MVLSEQEKAAARKAEQSVLAQKKAEQERLKAEIAAERKQFNELHNVSLPEKPKPKPKMALRIRYDIPTGQGRTRLEIEGSGEELGLFHLLQEVEKQLAVPVTQAILRPADEATWPLQPKEEMLPMFGSFGSIEDMPSLEALGLRNGQELFLTALADDVAPPAAAAAKPAAPAASSSSEAPEVPPAAQPVAEPPAPKPAAPQPAAPKPAAAKPAPASAPAGNAANAVIYKDRDKMKFVWRSLEERKLALQRNLYQREEMEMQRVQEEPETARLTGLLLWSPEETRYYSKLKAELDGVVGLEPVKEFIVQRLRDAAGRHILKEGKQSKRHVLISGHFGVGKRFAADLIGKLFALLSGTTEGGQVQVGSRVRLAAQSDPENRGALLSRADLGVVAEELPRGSAKPMRVRGPSGRFGNYKAEELVAERDVLQKLNSMSDLVDAKTGQFRIAEGTCYYLNLGAGGATLAEADAVILEAVLEHGSMCVMTGPKESVEANLQISTFRRRQPDLLELPTLGPTELARMIAASAEKKGYTGVGEGDVGTPEVLLVLENIVRQRFDDAFIREKNAHLAKDILDLAISRKNDRTWNENLDSFERFRLNPSDFGLDALTAEQREKRMAEVEETIAELVGWGKEDEAGSPRHFFATLRSQRSGGGGPAPNLPRAIWISANPGAGIDTFVQLAARFLRACGVMSREEVVWVNGSAISADSVAASLSAANRGCLAIRGAEALADNRDALRDLVVSLESPEASTMLIILVGTSSGMSRIARMDAALEARFSTQVKMPDFTAAELVTFMEVSAANLPSGALSIEDGVTERLEVHINETYGGGAGGKELGERGNLALGRQLLQRAVQNRMQRLFNKIQEGERPGEKPESECLIATDFEIGAPLGEGEEQRKAIDQAVDDLIGMAKAKEWFEQVRHKVAFVEQTGTRSDLHVCLNIIITGNPGTGKTTFARLLAKFFHTYGVLSKDSFVEKNGLELKAEYMGGTAPRVKQAVQEAMGGCLFLDEAYALIDSNAGVGSHGDAFSQEAMRTLLTEVENNRTNLMVVLAGYKDKMGRLMRADEGLARRFPNRLHLDDYSPADLAQICEMDARKRHQREFDDGLTDKLKRHIENFYWRDIPEQNAGLAVNLTEQALDRQIVRIVAKYPTAFSVPLKQSSGMQRQPSSGSASPEPLLSRQRSSNVNISAIKAEAAFFTAADFGIEERPTLGDPEMKKEVQAEVDGLIGMANVKAFFKEMELSVKFVENGGDPKVLQTSLNLQLTGNPGTGKTTVARYIARYLHAHGVLPRDAFVERNALVLKGQFVGQTAPTVVEAVRDAMGGCLFIDEAYALADRGGDKFSGEVIRTLLTEVENNRTGLLVVLAGYANKMDQLMDADPGLRRRFSLVLQLEDYSPEELAYICEKTAQEKFKLSFSPGLHEALTERIGTVHGHEIGQHNGGLAVTLAERAFRRLAMRLGRDGDEASRSAAATVLLPEDFEIGIGAGGSAAKHATKAPPAKRAGAEQPQSSGQKAPQLKRFRSDWKEVVDHLAKGLAAQLIAGGGDELLAEADDDIDGGAAPSGPTREERGKAIAKVLAKGKEKEKQKETPKEEEQVPVKEGERVIEEMDTLDALDKLGQCPASFEWFEINVADPPQANCGICHFQLSDGYRCGGGTHFVCLGCIDAYKTREVC